MQVRETILQILAPLLPRRAVHPGRRVTLQRQVGGPRRIDIDMVRQRGELQSPVSSRCFSYALQPR